MNTYCIHITDMLPALEIDTLSCLISMMTTLKETEECQPHVFTIHFLMLRKAFTDNTAFIWSSVGKNLFGAV